MKGHSLIRLVVLSLTRDRPGAAFSGFGVAVGVGALVFFVSLGLGVGEVVRGKVFPVDTSLVDVVAPSVSLGTLLGGGKLDQAAVDRLGAIPGVARAFRKMSVRQPAVSRYDGDFFGVRLRMGIEVIAVGVDPGLVTKDVELGTFEDPRPGEPIPGVAASRLLEIYNKTFAPARSLPQLSPVMVTGFTFPVEFNRSFVAPTLPGPTTSAQVQVVGVSDRGLLAGITIPLATAQRLNRAAGVDAETFSGVALLAEDPSRVPSIIGEVREMGFQIDDQERKLAQSAGAAVAVTTSAFALLSVLICVLAGVNIAHALSASVRARAREIGVMRAVGGTRGDIRTLILAEALCIGVGGGALGTAVAKGVAVGVDRLASRYLPPFPFKPETFFAFPTVLWVGGVTIGVVAALLGAFLPARRASGLDPARILTG